MRHSSWWILPGLWFVGLGICAGFCAAGDEGPENREHVAGFDDERTSWSIRFDETAVRLIRHIRTADIRHDGQAAELIDVETGAETAGVQLGYELPPARLIDDLRLSLWFQSNQDGANLAVRVVFPHQIDPTTGKALTAFIEGDAYSRMGQWQKLDCKDLALRLTRMLPQLRRRLQMAGALKHDIDRRGLYVDLAVINIPTSRGPSRFVVDELRFGPIVAASAERRINLVQESVADPDPEATFRLDRLHVRGRPFFPRIIPYRGEQPEELGRMRLNVAWVPDANDARLLEDLNRSGLRVMAIPPRAPADDGRALDPGSAHLAPFGPETSPILFWYLGTHIPPEKKQEVAAWQEQIRNADRVLKRPLMGDVAGLERMYSRQLSMLGVSRPAVQTSFGLRSYRDWLIEHRNLAQPGSFVWTWVQTEPTPAVADQRHAVGWNPLVVEPEQVRLEVCAAVSSGCRGIGFWTHHSLDEKRPGGLETKLMIAILNMELELLEPLLAAGTLSSQTPFTVQAPVARTKAATPSTTGASAEKKGKRADELNDREIELRKRDQLKRDLEAAVFQTDLGTLVLPVWYADEAQYVPGQMAANQAKIVVPGVGESARAWEITTTEIRALDAERVTGGKQVILPKFDMTTAILFTENEMLIERFRDKMKTLAEPAARVTLELARAKLERVAGVDLDLHKLGKGQPDAPRILARAKDCIDRAESAWRAKRFHDSRLDSADAMQLLRVLQYAYWSDAVRRMYAPVSSPHTLCFQTLPDHWSMIARFGRTLNSPTRNVLRSGDFEDFDTMVAEGWKHEQVVIDGIRATAELYPRAHKGTYSLRLIAAPAAGRDTPASIPARPVSVTTPPVTVYKGQLVYISGWVCVAAPSLGNLDGAMLYDSLSGAGAALRWRTEADWKKFELVREVSETTELTLTMALSGLGEIRFDDLEIIPLDVDASSGGGSGTKATPASRPGRGGPFDFLRRLPGFKGKTDAE